MSCYTPNNIVQNCGFETGSLNPWIIESGTSLISISISIPHTGTYTLKQGNFGSIKTVSQTLSTVPGAIYELKYFVWMNFGDDPTNYFSAVWNGSEIPDSIISIISNISPDQYIQFTFFGLLATSNNTVLSFRHRNDLGFYRLDDVSVVFSSGPCFHGKSKLLTKNIQTSEIATINAFEVLSGVHEVFSINDQQFTPVIHNIVAGPNTDFMLIKKDTFGINVPFDDFYITEGHPIIINGKEIEAKNISQAQKIKLEPSLVYTICINKREPFNVNNLDVLSWEPNEWNQTSKNHNIIWYDNGKPNIIYNLK